MWSAIASVLLGVVGWLGVSFVGKPLLDFLNLRSQVHEAIIFTGNVGPMATGGSDYEKAEDSLRRLGAKVHATNATASLPLRWYLSKAGYDLVRAGGGCRYAGDPLGSPRKPEEGETVASPAIEEEVLAHAVG